MCGRYSILSKDEVLEKRFNAQIQKPLYRHYNAAPTQKLPVITSDQPRVIQSGIWGLKPQWLDPIKNPVGFINARSETLVEKPSFRRPFSKQRCLIIADGFFEWHRSTKGKQPYYFSLADKGPFAFAGLWEPIKPKDKTPLSSFTIITTQANSLVSPIHDRMPVILSKAEEQAWLKLDTDTNQLMTMLNPFPDKQMRLYPVSSAVNSPTVDTAEVLKKIKLSASSQSD
jgi:putative SOS response-associated peptidase YedK